MCSWCVLTGGFLKRAFVYSPATLEFSLFSQFPFSLFFFKEGAREIYFGETKLTMLTKLSLHLLNIKSNHGIIWEFSLFALFFLWLFGMQSKVFIWWRITLKCMGYCDFGRLRTLIFRREPLPFPLRKWNTSCFWNSPWSVIHSGLVTS